jgi:hypothetical protein
MKNIFTFLLITIILLSSGNLYAQLGVGTSTPEESSILDVYSQNKGFLMPRLTTTQRNLIVDPAEGLMIYNTTLNDVELNVGGMLLPVWKGTKSEQNLMSNSVSRGDSISNVSTTPLLISGMIVSPPIGNYSLIFNANQTSSLGDEQFTSSQGVTDVGLIYQDLMDVTATGTHLSTFGPNEILSPGVYDISGTASISGILTLDGNNDPDSIFIFRSTGAFSAGASTQVILINNAASRNIYWVSAGAMATGADSVLKGNLVSSAGELGLGARSDLEGRLFTKLGAITMGAGSSINPPTGESSIDLRILSSFSMFTASGAISDTAPTTINGDIGTAVGALTISGTHTGEMYSAGTSLNAELIANNTTYSIYKNGIEIVNSSRIVYSMNPALISLHAIVSILNPTDTIEIHWNVSEGESTIKNRSLSLIHF